MEKTNPPFGLKIDQTIDVPHKGRSIVSSMLYENGITGQRTLSVKEEITYCTWEYGAYKLIAPIEFWMPIDITKVNDFSRYQKGLKFKDLFHFRKDGICACGCGRTKQDKRKTFAYLECTEIAYAHYRVIKGDRGFIKHELEKRDGLVCARCGKNNNLEMDHRLPVYAGGGGCTLRNWQWLCDTPCHINKTNEDSAEY